jgi:hypothetical protein
VLFYALLFLFVTAQVDRVYLIAALDFRRLPRALHSIVHCTFNLVILRFYLYLAASLAL